MSWEIWVTNYGSNEVTRLDDSGNYLGWYSVGSHPFALAFDTSGVSGMAFVTNSGDTTVSVINPLDPTNIAEVDVSGNPHGICTDPDGNLWAVLYNNPDTGNLVMIDKDYPHNVTPYDLETSGVINPELIICLTDESLAFITHEDVTGGGMVSMLPLPPNRIYETIRVGLKPFMPMYHLENDVSGFVWVVNYGSNSVSKIGIDDSGGDPCYFETVQEFPVGNGPRCIAWIDPSGTVDNRIWVTNELSNDVSILDLEGNSKGTLKIKTNPIGILNQDESDVKLWIACFSSNNIRKFQSISEDGECLKTIGIGPKPFLINRKKIS